MSVDLAAIRDRATAALDAKPSKGPWTQAGIEALIDSACDVHDLVTEVERLRALGRDDAWLIRHDAEVAARELRAAADELWNWADDTWNGTRKVTNARRISQLLRRRADRIERTQVS